MRRGTTAPRIPTVIALGVTVAVIVAGCGLVALAAVGWGRQRDAGTSGVELVAGVADTRVIHRVRMRHAFGGWLHASGAGVVGFKAGVADTTVSLEMGIRWAVHRFATGAGSIHDVAGVAGTSVTHQVCVRRAVDGFASRTGLVGGKTGIANAVFEFEARMRRARWEAVLVSGAT